MVFAAFPMIGIEPQTAMGTTLKVAKSLYE
jgi:hypothetical protein